MEEKEQVREEHGEVAWKDRKHFLWFPITTTKYSIQNDRLYIQRGLVSTKYDETLLYRITDIILTRSLGQKLFGTGTIELCTKVDHDQHILLANIKNPKEVRDLISKLVDDSRNEKGVAGTEMYGGGIHR